MPIETLELPDDIGNYSHTTEMYPCTEHEGCTVIELSEEYSNTYHMTRQTLHDVIAWLQKREQELWP